MAAITGFEPVLSESKSYVLPLHHIALTKLLIPIPTYTRIATNNKITARQAMAVTIPTYTRIATAIYCIKN